MHCMVHEMLDLCVLSHVSLHGGLPKRKLFGECLKPFEAPRSQHSLARAEQDDAQQLLQVRCLLR